MTFIKIVALLINLFMAGSTIVFRNSLLGEHKNKTVIIFLGWMIFNSIALFI